MLAAVANMKGKIMFCMNCGTDLPNTASFCFSCGTRTAPVAAQPEASSTQREPPASRKVFLLPLALLVAAALLLTFGITGITSNESVAQPSSAAITLSGAAYVEKGSYDICAIYNFQPTSSYRPAIIFKFTNNQNGNEYIGGSVDGSSQGRYHLIAKVEIKESGTFDITVSGIDSGLVMQNVPVDQGLLSLLNYQEISMFKSNANGFTFPFAIVMASVGAVLAIFMLLAFDYARMKSYNVNARPKSRRAALILACIPHTGMFGIHRMYLGYVGIGIIQLFTCGGVMVWWIIDIVKIAGKTMVDVNGNLLRARNDKT